MLHQLPSKVLHRFRTVVKDPGNLTVSPVGPLSICFQQNLRSTHFLATTKRLDYGLEVMALVVAQADNIGFLHG